MTVAVTLALLPAACTSASSRSAKPPSATTTSTSAATTTVDPTTAAILAAYRAHWDDVIAVDTVFPVRPQDPRIANHAIGKQLTSERDALTHLSVVGHFERGLTEFSPTVTSIAADTATVSDCIFDHSVEVDEHTNLPIEPEDIGHTLDNFTLTRINGVWFVADSMVVKSGKTGDACTPVAS